ncbi:Zn-dependent amino- or carboxypeptidase, M28 family [Streptomyces zhaozhouensis]|uniref:Zn-dependent amino- or carboxypeptidase, M28 family n=1 Tax=Streptomyces zhaozhouensis TaxID=1300267 RepID=A0A286E9M6_9ACTN|nr:M28 family peptidase [Streptomyces zhaozhouensis]SOD67608.1 Zn-dependent amino- or carboxypeptidase, M28 family [Streptomyces zhaozhouensis]
MIAFVATALALALAAPWAPSDHRETPTAAAERGEALGESMADGLTAADTLRHLDAFQSAAEAAEGHRAAGSPGHEISARHAARVLTGAGLRVAFEHFTFPYRETLAERLTLLPTGEEGGAERDIPVRAMAYTGDTAPGGLTAALTAVPAHGTGGAGCAAEDFAGLELTGRVALMERGECTYAEKQANAASAGAVAALVYNSEAGELAGTLGDPDPAALPVGGLAREDGLALLAALAEHPGAPVRLELRELVEDRETFNVIADTPGGDPASTVVVGAHLDSVAEGPGINDNASGSAAVLATALALAEHEPAGAHPHRVRFALWSAEEMGLRGAEHHVARLSPAAREATALYLNLDMAGSPNHGLFVHDGAGLDDRSAAVAEDLAAFLGDGDASRTRTVPFNGRSDYAPFLEAGIPAGGTFAGGEGLKTAEEAALWGGTAGEPYDPCYHRACDTVENVSTEALAAHTRALARAVGRYAWHLP